MFEGVLEIFTPDVPSSISGRARYVHVLCQYLLLLFNNLKPCLVTVY